ncbi:MAG TPA: prenyltransferase/squalene oxidase repeat-containing protein [Acidobacteriaceae bacterium]|nr:prenyltransferase/squalene oxidase repeat-containing protein [Acidobacteriaceae bacterium]
MMPISRREILRWSLIAAASGSLHATAFDAARFATDPSTPNKIDGRKIKDTTFQFIEKCARKDGGYSPSPDRNYKGSSDTAESDLAAVTYAATLAKPEGRTLAHANKSADFIQHHQQPDGVFVNLAGNLDPKADLAVLYNTVQGVVGLRALGEKPRVNPVHVMDRFFDNNAFAKLPWYTVSFFPLFYAALRVTFPPAYRNALEQHLQENQAADGYLGDHVAATFHLVHFYRLIGQPTPKGDAIVQRVLRDQRPDGGWQLKAPDWDVHSCFDAVFILRQLGNNSPACRAAIAKAAHWALRCQNADGGFGHYPGLPSDMDAVYFQFGTLIQAGLIPGTNFHLPDAETLSWGHVMQPGVIYRTT